MENKFIAFTGTLGGKEAVVALARSHREADRLKKGSYNSCSIGCMTGGRNHHLLPELTGVHPLLGHLEDVMFESCPDNKSAANFHVAFWEALPDAADTERAHWLCLARLYGKRCVAFPENIEVARAVLADAFFRAYKGEDVDFKRVNTDLAYRADRAYLAYLADRAYLAYLAYRADRAYLADRAYRADLAYLAYLADREKHIAEGREIFLSVLKELPVSSLAIEK